MPCAGAADQKPPARWEIKVGKNPAAHRAEMLKMTGLEEVVGRRQLLACPDVPAARAAGGRVPEAVDGKHTRPDISCYADHLAGQNWRSRDPESPGHIAATAEIDLHHVRRLRAAARSWRWSLAVIATLP